jgi:hypothetical protein
VRTLKFDGVTGPECAFWCCITTDTGAANEDNRGTSDDEDRASSNVSSNINFSPPNELQTARSEEFIAQRSTPQEDMCDESLSQPAPSKGSSQSKASGTAGHTFSNLA